MHMKKIIVFFVIITVSFIGIYIAYTFFEKPVITNYCSDLQKNTEKFCAQRAAKFAGDKKKLEKINAFCEPLLEHKRKTLGTCVDEWYEVFDNFYILNKPFDLYLMYVRKDIWQMKFVQ